MNFYVVLPSNSVKENTPSKFLTTLKNPIIFENPEEWRVGLIEMNFRNALKTIYKDRIIATQIQTFTKDTNQFSVFGPSSPITFPFESKIYCESDDKTPVESFHLIIATESGTVLCMSGDDQNTAEIVFKYQEGKIRLNTNSDHVMTISISRTLAYMWGFINNEEKYVMTDDRFLFTKITRGEYIAPYAPLHVKAQQFTHIVSGMPEAGNELSSYSVIYHDITKRLPLADISPKAGKYFEATKLAEEFVKPDFNSFFKIDYNKQENKFNLTTPRKDDEINTYEIAFLGGLNDVLGFKKQVYTSTEISSGVEATLRADLERGITTIFVYCDLCQYINVGNTKAQLLRPIVFNTSRYGEMVHIHFDNPMYVPVNKSNVDTIEMKLCDAAGEVIGFVEGMTTAVLHFKHV